MPQGALTIRKATAEDFERVYPLLQSFADPPIAKEVWRKIFFIPWKSPEDFCGYVLLKDEDVKGYLGLLFSERQIEGRLVKFCNMTSWIVSEECRGQSLPMLLQALKLKDCIVTNFTASPTVAKILVKLGFTEFSVDQLVLFPVPSLGTRGRDCIFALEEIRGELTGDALRIFEDHQALDCEHLLLRSNKGDCYVILKRTKRKNLSFAKVHYLGNAEVFHDCMETLIARICFRLKVFGVMVDERYTGGRKFKGSVKYPHQRKAYFKSDTIGDEKLIDTAYSELVVLHN
jgi:hypothetical protein